MKNPRLAVGLGLVWWVMLAFMLLTLAGCATTLTHPTTGQTATCKSGWAVGAGTGIAGVVMIGLSLAADIFYIAEYRACLNKAKAAGYEESKAPPPTLEPSRSEREH